MFSSKKLQKNKNTWKNYALFPVFPDSNPNMANASS